MYNKTITRFGFCDIRNNQGLGWCYKPKPLSSADNPYLDLDYSGYHKNLAQLLFKNALKSIILSSNQSFFSLKPNVYQASFEKYSYYRLPISCAVEKNQNLYINSLPRFHSF